MIPRIEPAKPPFAPEIEAALARLMPEGVAPLTLFATLARDRRLFGKLMAGGLLDRGNLTLRRREIVIDRVTARNGSEYEWGVHVAFFAERAGLNEAQQYSLVHGGHRDPCWHDPGERLLIRLCDALEEESDIEDELWTALAKEFSAEAILEAVMLAGYYRTISYLTNALRLSPEGFAARFPEQAPESAHVE